MIKFGTGGWRALIGDEFTRENICLLAQGLADKMKQENETAKGIVLGFDRRFLSDNAAGWVAEVFAGNGITVHFINRFAPTPLIMFTVKTLDTAYGMAITASHNPAAYNGIKVFTRGGRDASAEVTADLEVYTQKAETVNRMEYDEAVACGLILEIDPMNEYVDAILAMIDTQAIRKANLRVLIDPMFGVSKKALQTVLISSRCEVDLINERHDVLFGGRMPSPARDTLRVLRYDVTEQGYDMGIGTDGDADRIGIIDDNGHFIHPNEILLLLYYYLLKYKGWKGPVVRNLATTQLLDRIAADFGQVCYEVPVGFKHISSKMEETGALIGGESSGGLTIRGHILGKDGVFAAALLVELVAVTGKPLSSLLDEIYGKYGSAYMTEEGFSFTQAKKDALQTLLFTDKKLPAFPALTQKVSYADGLKVYFSNGWIIARFSGTEPLIRLFCEMPTQEEAEAVAAAMKDFLELS